MFFVAQLRHGLKITVFETPDISMKAMVIGFCIRVAEPESESWGVGGFGWSRSRIPNNTGSRIFLSNSNNPIGSFLHYTPKLGIPVEMVQFLLKLLLKQTSESETLERSDILSPTPQPWFLRRFSNAKISYVAWYGDKMLNFVRSGMYFPRWV